METRSKETQKPKLVAIGRHLLPCISANDYIELGERRWHALHNRASEMLEDARADSSHRVEHMKAIYELRDRTTALAIQHAATLEGAIEVIEHAASKAKVSATEAIAEMQPEAVIEAALGLCGISLKDPPDPK